MSEKTKKYGVFHNISNENYHNDIEFLSSSQLKKTKNMVEFKHSVLEGEYKEPSESMILGTALHTLVLEPSEFKNEYMIYNEDEVIEKALLVKPDAKNIRATKDFKQLKEEALSKSGDRHIISFNDYNKLLVMEKSLTDNKLVAPLLEGGIRESSIYYNLQDIDLRIRPDLLNIDKGYIVDLKTTRDMNWFGYDAKKKFDYDLSASMYIDGCKEVFKQDMDFYFVVVQNCEPYTSAVFKLNPETYKIGKDKYSGAIEKIKEARFNDDYSFQKEIEEI